MKIVLDTTILVRANEHSHGLARELLISIVRSRHTLLLSNEMLHELARVLRYPRLQTFYDLPESLVFDYVSLTFALSSHFSGLAGHKHIACNTNSLKTPG